VDYDEALKWLSDHISLEADTSARAAGRRLEGTARLAALLGDPQRAYPAIHITGTNGKGSVARIVTRLLMAMGLSVGTYTSPDLEGVNERMAWNAEPIGDTELAEAFDAVRLVEPLLDGPPTHFEILTTAAFRWFADVAVDVAVVEVGLGGRWDSTNIVDGAVAAVTNVELDHAEVIGPLRTDIATEKAGIVKGGATLVLGETDPALVPIFRATPAAQIWLRGEEFGCDSNDIAVGGRVLDIHTPGARYEGVFLPLHGDYQGDNAAVALAAAEAFFAAPLDPDVVAEGFAAVRNPGRMEVMGRHPLVILDGAHNPAGAAASARTVASEFGAATGRILVVGLNKGRDPAEMLAALDAGRARLVLACPPPSPRAVPPDEVAAAARAMGVDAATLPSPAAALDRALEVAEPDELVLVTGSLYVVGAARTAWRTLRGR
jgi:dihydrofolate synthase/folylpolyglutamate synthase